MLTRHDPLLQEFDRLTQSMFGSTAAAFGAPMDVLRKDDEILVLVDLPAADPESIDVTIDKDVLTVSARREFQVPDGASLLLHERPSGSVARQVHLPDTLDRDGVEAAYDNGVLRIRIPLAEEAKPKRIAVRRADDQRAIDS